MDRYKRKYKEKLGDFSKATDKWYSDIVDLGELHFEKKKQQPELLLALHISEKNYMPYAMTGSKAKDFEQFRKDVMKLKDKHFKKLKDFLKKLKPGDFDMESVIKNAGFKDVEEYDMVVDIGDTEPIEGLSDKEFLLWSNDDGGNSSVVNSIMDLFSQAVNYFGDIENYLETELKESEILEEADLFSQREFGKAMHTPIINLWRSFNDVVNTAEHYLKKSGQGGVVRAFKKQYLDPIEKSINNIDKATEW